MVAGSHREWTLVNWILQSVFSKVYLSLTWDSKFLSGLGDLKLLWYAQALTYYDISLSRMRCCHSSLLYICFGPYSVLTQSVTIIFCFNNHNLIICIDVYIAYVRNSASTFTCLYLTWWHSNFFENRYGSGHLKNKPERDYFLFTWLMARG